MKGPVMFVAYLHPLAANYLIMVRHTSGALLLGAWAVIATLARAQDSTVAPTPAPSSRVFQTGSPGPSKLPYENGSGLWIEYEEFDLRFQTKGSEDDNDDYYDNDDDDDDGEEHIPKLDEAQDIVDSLEALMREQSLQQLGDDGVDFWFPHVELTVIDVVPTRPPPTGNPPKKKLACKTYHPAH